VRDLKSGNLGEVAPDSHPDEGDYVMIALLNEGAQELGYRTRGTLARGVRHDARSVRGADRPPLGQVKPFYSDLHCYVRAKLNEVHDAVQTKTGPIRADLLGNMWSQEWGNIYDVVAPKDGAGLGYDLTKQLEAKGYTPQSMVKTAENFYISLGFDPWPKSCWERSMLVRPRDRKVQCHASAWDIDNKDDIRLKACIHVNADDFSPSTTSLATTSTSAPTRTSRFCFRTGPTTASTKRSATSPG
jgi:peptidyl-dipeptidase A